MTETNATIHTHIPGPKSQQLMERRKKFVSRGVSYSTEIFAQEAKGALIKDVDGNVFVDFASGIGVVNIGHCDDDVVAAIKNQSDKFIHTSANVVQYDSYINLAEVLSTEVYGNSPKKVMFANSGAEAVENAIKIARKYTGKTAIISIDGSFHGRTYMAMTLTTKNKPYKYGFAPFNSDCYKMPQPNCYRCPLGKTADTCQTACADKLTELLTTALTPETTAALIVEPVQGEGGFVPMPKEYLSKVQKICKDNNIMFIVDEIQSGFARTGKMFCCENYEVEPDLITLSKSIAGGVPISAVVGMADIMDSPIAGSIGGTFSGNPLACAAGVAVINKMKNEDFSKKASQLGDYMVGRLNKMQQKFEVIGDVRGIGAMVAIELVKDTATKEPEKELVANIISYCLQRGVIFLSAGILGNCIRFLPPLVMTQSQVEYGMDVLEMAFENC